MRIGVDTGGTFTDLVGDDGAVVKVPSTPDDPGVAVGAAIVQVAAHPPEPARARHDGGDQRAARTQAAAASRS